jgi:hypothetical protein
MYVEGGDAVVPSIHMAPKVTMATETGNDTGISATSFANAS